MSLKTRRHCGDTESRSTAKFLSAIAQAAISLETNQGEADDNREMTGTLGYYQSKILGFQIDGAHVVSALKQSVNLKLGLT